MRPIHTNAESAGRTASHDAFAGLIHMKRDQYIYQETLNMKRDIFMK